MGETGYLMYAPPPCTRITFPLVSSRRRRSLCIPACGGDCPADGGLRYRIPAWILV